METRDIEYQYLDVRLSVCDAPLLVDLLSDSSRLSALLDSLPLLQILLGDGDVCLGDLDRPLPFILFLY